MDLPQETEEYIRESIESSLGLQISAKNMQIKLLASEDARHRLQDQVFLLEERLHLAEKRIEQYKAEASMNALGLRKCVEEKEVMAAEFAEMANHCSKLERECSLYERDRDKVMESFDELAKENEELRLEIHTHLQQVEKLTVQVESLQKDKEHLCVNLNRAEEEVKVLFEENKMLDEENKRLLERERERNLRSERKASACASATGKRKSSLMEGSPTCCAIDFAVAEHSRHPLSQLYPNSPDSRACKK